MDSRSETELRAVAFIQRLVDKGSWYYSAIELDHDISGDDLHLEAKSIIADSAAIAQSSNKEKP